MLRLMWFVGLLGPESLIVLGIGVQLVACTGVGELPVSLGVALVAICVPGGDFICQCWFVWDAPIGALG